LILGEIPFVGTGVDIANAGIAFSNGDILGGILNGASAIPFLGAGIKIGKKALKGVKAWLEGLFSKGHAKDLKDKESAQQQYENWKNGNGFE
jgi:hypothetical protein